MLHIVLLETAAAVGSSANTAIDAGLDVHFGQIAAQDLMISTAVDLTDDCIQQIARVALPPVRAAVER